MKTTRIPRMVLICMSLIAFSCSGAGDLPEEGTDTAGQEQPVSAPAADLVGKAGQISYWKHTGRVKDAVSVPVVKSVKSAVSYPFETITIHKVTRYTAVPFSAGPFKDISELFVTEFSVDYGSSLLLTFRYEAGGYSCIDNGGRYEPGISEKEFSSHIRLGAKSIEKEFTYPLYGFYLRSVSGAGTSLGYTMQLTLGEPTEPKVWFPLKDGDEVTANDVYNVAELTGKSYSQP